MGRGAPSSQQSPEHHTVLWQRAGGRGRGQERLNPGPARTQLARAAAAGEEFGKCFLPHLGNHGCLWLYGKSQSLGLLESFSNSSCCHVTPYLLSHSCGLSPQPLTVIVRGEEGAPQF